MRFYKCIKAPDTLPKRLLDFKRRVGFGKQHTTICKNGLGSEHLG